MFTINIQEGAPRCRDDFWMLHFLRTYADCIITTGQILRKEPRAFLSQAHKMLGFDPKVAFSSPKPVAILTNTLNHNLEETNVLYQDPHY